MKMCVTPDGKNIWGRGWVGFSTPAPLKPFGGPLGGASGDALTFIVSSSNIGRNIHTKLLILYCLLGNHQQLMKSRKTILVVNG
jgi:hypothetical protein